MQNKNNEIPTIQKALQINLDENIYGTIAEIGAGQEVARNFFLAGGAAGTIAKTMSAYDMQVSDAIYGEEVNRRYVSMSRVKKMIDREYNLVVERLENVRHENTLFFAFADTVAAKGYKSKRDCHGWMGLKFQLNPKAKANEIILHVRMKDESNEDQQAALGVLGVNIIHSAFYNYNDPRKIIETLSDNLGNDRIEVDMIRFSGPDFKHVDNRLMALHLIKSWLTRSVMFDSNGETVPSSELLYKKNIMLLRGSFRPFTKVHEDISLCGKEAFLQESEVNEDNMVFLAEISMIHIINQAKQLNEVNFLGRIDTLCKMGFCVQITDYLRFFKVKQYLRQFTSGKIGIVLGIRDLKNSFTEHFYDGLSGGILEGLSILFADDTKLYIYPKHNENKKVITLNSVEIDDQVKFLFKHFVSNKKLIELKSSNQELLQINTRVIRDELQYGDGEWKHYIPEVIYQDIVSKKLFGYGSQK